MRTLEELPSSDPLKEATINALERMIDPSVNLMLDAGITVQEYCRLVRERAVRYAAQRLAKEGVRSSNSRVAIVTGLARAEVARILSKENISSRARPRQNPARKVLAAWHDNRRFLGTNGDPAVLPIFGRRKSFEQLVATSTSGIPVRAMLDQLTQINAVDILAGQRVKVKSRVPIFKGMTATALGNVGERASDLLGTLTRNLHTTSDPLFEETALLNDVDIAAVPLVRRQLAEQGVAFIESATSLLARSSVNMRRLKLKASRQCRVGVTVYYFQDVEARDECTAVPVGQGHRRNLQRRHNKSKVVTKKNAKSSRGGR
jgi:hypothetical protein